MMVLLPVPPFTGLRRTAHGDDVVARRKIDHVGIVCAHDRDGWRLRIAGILNRRKNIDRGVETVTQIDDLVLSGEGAKCQPGLPVR